MTHAGAISARTRVRDSGVVVARATGAVDDGRVDNDRAGDAGTGGAPVPATVLTGEVISGAVPSGAVPSGAVPSGAVPSGVALSGAALSGAALSGAAADRPTWLPPAVVSTQPLREPDRDVLARRAARRAAGLDDDGLGYPRSHLWVLAVLPATVLTLLFLILMLVTDSTLLGLAAIGAAAVAGGTTGYLVRDPLRVSSAERRALVADRNWQSSQSWVGAPATTPERTMVSIAQDAVQSLVRAPAWSSPAFEEHRIRLDLKAELDEVDRQAYDLAVVRPQLTPQSRDAHAAASAALRRRVESLRAYADAVVAIGGTPKPSDASAHERQLESALVATVRDEFAIERLAGLHAELPSLQSPPETLPR